MAKRKIDVNQVRGIGTATGCDLSDIQCLLRPARADAWGEMQPELTEDLLKLSAELASVAYTMEVEPWLHAGWRDVTLQVDGVLTGGIEPVPERSLSGLLNAVRIRHAARQLKKPGPMGELLGAVHQMKSSNTGKALVMLHPTQDGRYVVAIGFTGTGRRLYDWLSNFRMMADNGFHRGFMQLALQLEANERSIVFPQTAAELGLEKLTLSSILDECRHPNSRFIIWMAGHSQGGAVMQVWTHFKLMEMGVLPQNMVGVGFASPSAVEGTAVEHPSRYPLMHVINSDDVVPRMGAMVHLGQLMIYPSGESLRSRCYCWPMTPDAILGRAAAKRVLCYMRSTPDSIVVLAACMRLLQNHPVNEIVEMLGMLQGNPVTKPLLAALDQPADGMLRVLMARCDRAYTSITGRTMPAQQVQRMMRMIQSCAASVGMKSLLAGLLQLCTYAHSMYAAEHADIGAYAYIASNGIRALRLAVWKSGSLPVLTYAEGCPSPVAVRCERTVRRVSAVPHRAVSRWHWQ